MLKLDRLGPVAVAAPAAQGSFAGGKKREGNAAVLSQGSRRVPRDASNSWFGSSLEGKSVA